MGDWDDSFERRERRQFFFPRVVVILECFFWLSRERLKKNELSLSRSLSLSLSLFFFLRACPGDDDDDDDEEDFMCVRIINRDEVRRAFEKRED